MHSFRDILPALGWDYLLSQVFAALCLTLVIIGYLQRNDRHLVWLMVAGCLLIIPHFYFLGAWAGVTASSVSLARFLTATRWPRSRLAFILLVIGGTLLNGWWYKDPRDLLVITANLLGCTALFLNQGMRRRQWFIANDSCWLLYSALQLSLVGVLLECTCTTFNLIGMYRLRSLPPPPL
jgi:hypothetical protein